MEPGAAGAHYGLGAIRLAQGAQQPAIVFFRRAVESDRSYIGALNDDAWRMATDSDPAVRAPGQALLLSTLANQLTGHERPMLLATLAAAQAASGEFDRAAQTMERALALADDRSAARHIPEFRERLALYRRGKVSSGDAAP